MTNRLEFPRILNLLLLFTFLTVNYSLDAQVFRTVKDDDEGGQGNEPACISQDDLNGLGFPFSFKNISDLNQEECNFHIGTLDSEGNLLDLASFDDLISSIRTGLTIPLYNNDILYQGYYSFDFNYSSLISENCGDEIINYETPSFVSTFDLNLYCMDNEGNLNQISMCDEVLQDIIYVSDPEFDCSEQSSISRWICCDNYSPDNEDPELGPGKSKIENNVDISLFINSNKFEIKTEFNNMEKIKMTMFDLNGNKVTSQDILNPNKPVFINNFAISNGAFIISLQQNNKIKSAKYMHINK